MHRDSFASHLGHADMVTYFSVAENEAAGRVRLNLLEVRARLSRCCLSVLVHAWRGLDRASPPAAAHTAVVVAGCRSQKMVQPCGPPPPQGDE